MNRIELMSNNTITITRLTSSSYADWDNYVEGNPQGTFFHLRGWETVIKEAFGHDTCYLMAQQDGNIVGVVPLGHIKSRLFGNALVSNPFCVYGGAIADTPEIRSQLEVAAETEAVEREVDYLELRNIEKTQNDWPVKELYVTFRKEIDPDPEVNLKAIPRRQRRMVRLGIKAGLESSIHDTVDEFFKIYSASVRNHGTPIFPKKYFELLKNVFAEKCEIRVVKKGKKTISTVMSFYFRDEVLPYYGGGIPDARKYNAFDFMYWDLMRASCQQGVRIFDYGRSKLGTGPYSFKKNWGFTPEPLQYQYRLVGCESMPEVNPLNPKYQLFIKVWKHLPLPIANAVGPLLARSLG